MFVFIIRHEEREIIPERVFSGLDYSLFTNMIDWQRCVDFEGIAYKQGSEGKDLRVLQMFGSYNARVEYNCTDL